MLEALLKGITFGLLLNLSVGPVLFSIIKQSLSSGHKGGLAFAFGVSASDITLVLISNVFTELFRNMIAHKDIIGIAGCAFLISLGVYLLFFKKVEATPEGKQVMKFSAGDYVRIFFSGYLMNTLNPAVFIFWITTSTAVITHTIQQRIIIFATCLALTLGGDILKVMLAGKIRNRLTPHNIHIINRISGMILIGFGIALIWGLLIYK
ncbi:MAG: LysE family translocator [Chitinophagales bacterium]|nr:LysE family translocator [Chitinophagales bacterium]